jgi:parallel beta-helix repeat protein
MSMCTPTKKYFVAKKLWTIVCLPVLLLLFSFSINATNYYVSNTGDDSKEGTTTQTAWKTLNKVNNTKFAPGDSILFERGGVWREELKVPSSGAPGNPIVFGAYGSGAKPEIDGADVISGMTSAGSNIWQKTAVTIQPNLMYLDGVIGYPKTSLGACTSERDWYWDSGTNTLFVYTEKGDPSGNVELGQRKMIVFIGSNENITVSNLNIQHSNELNNPAVAINNSGGIFILSSAGTTTISWCTIQKNGHHGIAVQNSSNIIIDGNTILRNGESHKKGHNVWIYADITGTSNITFSNNQSNYSGHDGFRIHADYKENYITNVDIHGNTFNNNNAAGLYVQKLDSAVVYNNSFHSNGDPVDDSEDYGIGISSCDNLDVYNNTITNQLWGDAIQAYSDSTARYGSSHNMRLFRNYISDVTYGDGIHIAARDGQTFTNPKVYYNIINSVKHFGIMLGHADSGIPDSLDVFNNTFYNNENGGVLMATDFPVVIKNNIFANNGLTDVRASNSTTTGLTTSNNLYYRTSGNVLRYAGNAYTVATIRSFEANAQNKDPLFTDAANGDFSLQAGSPAINNGVDVGLTKDILGNPIVGTPDIGAVESQKKTMKI